MLFGDTIQQGMIRKKGRKGREGKITAEENCRRKTKM